MFTKPKGTAIPSQEELLANYRLNLLTSQSNMEVISKLSHSQLESCFSSLQSAHQHKHNNLDLNDVSKRVSKELAKENPDYGYLSRDLSTFFSWWLKSTPSELEEVGSFQADSGSKQWDTFINALFNEASFRVSGYRPKIVKRLLLPFYPGYEGFTPKKMLKQSSPVWLSRYNIFEEEKSLYRV